MPPVPMRKASVATTDTTPVTGRRQSGRQPRTTTSRPINYYARTFGSLQNPQDDTGAQEPPGFFPAIQYFADSIDAMPKEVQRHITLMKEVEAKVYGPTEAVKSVSTNIISMPVPPPRNQQSSPRLLTFTVPNSAANSLNGSIINGVQPQLDHPVSDATESQQGEQADHARRAEFHNLRHLITNMIANLDEKNVVMAEANRTLQHQLNRLDSVVPHIENEISEESRLGNTTHWAYAENRVKKQSAPSQHERARRDVAATSSLAAAAQAVHEGDIAAARGEARREAKKTNRNHPPPVDSDFDDRPTKRAQTGKARKAQDPVPEQKITGLGIANGTVNAAPAKRRKVEKGPAATVVAAAAAAAAAPAMERSVSALSAMAKTGRGQANTTPRPTPTIEQVIKKKGKPGPAPGSAAAKKRYPSLRRLSQTLTTDPRYRNPALNQSANSPKLMSSPVLGNAQLHQDAPTSRPASSRMRQNSTSNLQHSLLPEKDASRPASVSDNKSVNGSAADPVDSGLPSGASAKDTNTGAEEADDDRMHVDEPARDMRPLRIDKTQTMKKEDMAMEDAGLDVPSLRVGRSSKVSTPRTDAFAADAITMTRTRSNRGHGSAAARGSNTPTDPGSAYQENRRRGRRKSGSGAHILKQIASYNRSPDTDRHRDTASDLSDIENSGEDGRSRRSQPPRVTTVSRGRRGNESRATTSSRRTEQPSAEPEEDAGEVADEEAEEVEEVEEAEEAEEVEEAEEAEDPNEPKYCYCGQGSFGEMIACDNDDCSMEWFHLGCTGLRAVPGDNVKWYCDVCKEAMQQAPRGKKGRPGSRH